TAYKFTGGKHAIRETQSQEQEVQLLIAHQRGLDWVHGIFGTKTKVRVPDAVKNANVRAAVLLAYYSEEWRRDRTGLKAFVKTLIGAESGDDYAFDCRATLMSSSSPKSRTASWRFGIALRYLEAREKGEQYTKTLSPRSDIRKPYRMPSIEDVRSFNAVADAEG
ncbi:MAG: hypothetical protein KDD62_10840, partial [Bdellovibrionales bacterium]|nr:hypothetical protein [Bdellovibrionales bacterium]